MFNGVITLFTVAPNEFAVEAIGEDHFGGFPGLADSLTSKSLAPFALLNGIEFVNSIASPRTYADRRRASIRVP
ncbi:hypothetical protein ACFPM1_04800 [Halorubrum rubrum]|uniref:Uncharacterized protein n=1 Tax=Halorubrum rubrum TaxID=1126240 RepID=A0ABD5QZE4_9EURY|nr:hypothetical protein [Halorubrum rubrum]